MTIDAMIEKMGTQACQARRRLARLNTAEKNQILTAMAQALHCQRDRIKSANQQDIKTAKSKGVSAALLDRLILNDDRIDAMIAAFETIIALDDPVGDLIETTQKENGLLIQKRRVPIGVIAMIYESRPNVTADVAALCLKSGNAILLRGGSDALRSNIAIVDILLSAGKAAGLPDNALQLISETDRDAVRALVQLEGKVDVVIPRGGAGLIQSVSEWARVPVIKNDKGLCHLYVDASADIAMALTVCENAKCQRPGVCNAIETLLVHQAIAPQFIPLLVNQLGDRLVLRGDPKACAISPELDVAHAVDWQTEYLDLILSIKVVDGVSAAITHINQYGSHHSDALIAADKAVQQRFLSDIDSAVVYINASTRFTDGSEFGMGAEIGISTGKLHARGPMGLIALTTYQYQVLGRGDIKR